MFRYGLARTGTVEDAVCCTPQSVSNGRRKHRTEHLLTAGKSGFIPHRDARVILDWQEGCDAVYELKDISL